MDALDRKILDAVQFAFPLSVRPFQSLARTLGVAEETVLERIGRLKEERVIRQISPIFSSDKIGYQSTLAAFRVPASRVEAVAAQLSASPAISHNYLRRNRYNLWFTVTLPVKQDLKRTVAAMAKSAGVKDWLFLPSLRTFKIQFQLTMGNKAAPALTVPEKKISKNQKKYKISPAFVRELQHDIPLCSRPYQAAAKKLRIGESEIVDRLKYMISTGALRRVAAVLRHAKAGFSINNMVAWAPGESQKEKLGAISAAQASVSHCYERPVSRTWPYSIYTMIHAKSVRGGQAVIKKISGQSGVMKYAELPTLKEYKKVRVQYF